MKVPKKNKAPAKAAPVGRPESYERVLQKRLAGRGQPFPTPWKMEVKEDGGITSARIYDALNVPVAMGMTEANAAMIVQAVNSFWPMIGAIGALVDPRRDTKQVFEDDLMHALDVFHLAVGPC
jgi:hypothetical protein